MTEPTSGSVQTAALRLRDRLLEIGPRRAIVMGIVNASPESFSDGAAVGGLEMLRTQARELVAAGADIIDVGGESGVTDRPPVSAAEEIARVLPLVKALSAEGMIVSVDTWKAEVARAALGAGAAMINDVSGLRELGVADACAATGAGLVIMHTRAAPKQKTFPGYDDVVGDAIAFLRERIAIAVERGVAPEQIMVDPGPDFSKTPGETVSLLRGLAQLAALGRPVLLAVSRKDFIGALTGRSPAGRLPGTLAAVGAGLDAGASIVRVHDVAATRDFMEVRAALRGERLVAPDLRLDPLLGREPASRA
ncbi:MAG: dihydropteroate synthase [Thermoleophilaceae bacterium]